MSIDRPAVYIKNLPEPKKIYVIDFFSGCGGMSWGFANTRQSHAAINVLAGIDIDKSSLKTYGKNIDALPIQADIREIAESPERLLELIPGFEPDTQRPLVFIGCPPCQGFSAHRKKDPRDDPRNDLFTSFVRLCAYYKPEVVVMENVPEILRGRYSHYYAAASSELRQLGYNLNAEILDLSRFGIPQRRRRAVVLGSLSGSIKMPSPIFTEENVPTVRDAISHLPAVEAGIDNPSDPYHRAPAHTPRILELIAKIPPNGGDRRALSPEEQLECHIQLDKRGSKGFTDVYGRLRWDAPSVTITAKSSTPSCGRFLHPEQNRNITVREAAILQGFPQTFMFEGAFVHQYRQIGEAVPPLFARFLAWQVLDHFSPRHRNGVITYPRKTSVQHKNAATALKVVDAFCGAGGISLGFEAAGYETAFAFDIDQDAVATYSQNISSLVERADVLDSSIPAAIMKSTDGSPYVLVGGPPCQGFSQQRRGSDDDDRNNLVVHYAELILRLEHKPLAVVLENVTYLDSPRGRRVLAAYLNTFREMGYQTYQHELNSADYAVPQLRRRIILVALHPAIAEGYVGPQPLTPRRWTTIGEVLADLPEPRLNSTVLWQISNHEESREGDLNRKRIAYVDMGNGRMSIPNDLQLDCHKTYDGHLDVYGRLDWFSQARTLTGGFDSFTRGEYAHPFHHRSITHREAARIQGFPDWFEFVGNRQSTRRQIGNAVPPPLAFAVGKAILQTLKSAQLAQELTVWGSL